MKLFFTILFTGCLSLSLLWGQSIEMLNVPAGLLDVPKDSTEMKFAFQIHNKTSDTLLFHVVRIENQMHANNDTAHSTYFCWDFCYGTSVDQSVEGITLLPGDTLNKGAYQQYISFQPAGIDGYSYSTLRFVNAVDAGDFIDVKYEFSVGGVNSVEDQFDQHKVLGAPYPNPAIHTAYIPYELSPSAQKGELRILNIIGREVGRISLDSPSGIATIPLDSYKSGIYIVNLIVESRNITSRKLIISK